MDEHDRIRALERQVTDLKRSLTKAIGAASVLGARVRELEDQLEQAAAEYERAVRRHTERADKAWEERSAMLRQLQEAGAELGVQEVRIRELEQQRGEPERPTFAGGGCAGGVCRYAHNETTLCDKHARRGIYKSAEQPQNTRERTQEAWSLAECQSNAAEFFERLPEEHREDTARWIGIVYGPAQEPADDPATEEAREWIGGGWKPLPVDHMRRETSIGQESVRIDKHVYDAAVRLLAERGTSDA